MSKPAVKLNGRDRIGEISGEGIQIRNGSGYGPVKHRLVSDFPAEHCLANCRA